MLNLVRIVVTAAAAAAFCASAQDPGPKRQEFAPPAANGRVVVLISGQTGMANYITTAQQIADAGFDVVLVDGNDFWIKDTTSAWNMLKDVIVRAEAGSHALPGKVALSSTRLAAAPRSATQHECRISLLRSWCPIR